MTIADTVPYDEFAKLRDKMETVQKFTRERVMEVRKIGVTFILISIPELKKLGIFVEDDETKALLDWDKKALKGKDSEKRVGE
jgi:hypothetical protein